MQVSAHRHLVLPCLAFTEITYLEKDRLSSSMQSLKDILYDLNSLLLSQIMMFKVKFVKGMFLRHTNVCYLDCLRFTYKKETSKINSFSDRFFHSFSSFIPDFSIVNSAKKHLFRGE